MDLVADAAIHLGDDAEASLGQGLMARIVESDRLGIRMRRERREDQQKSGGEAPKGRQSEEQGGSSAEDRVLV